MSSWGGGCICTFMFNSACIQKIFFMLSLLETANYPKLSFLMRTPSCQDWSTEPESEVCFGLLFFFFLNPLLLFHCCFFSLVVQMLSFHDHFHINCLPQFPVFSQSLGLSQNQIRIKSKITDFHYQPLIFSLLLQHFTRTLELSFKKIKYVMFLQQATK